MADDGKEQLSIVILDQSSGEKTHFKIKYKTKMGKVFKAWAEKKGINLDAVKFLFDGERVGEDLTPKLLNMDDGDQIDVFMEQVGGC
jgi:small ubiquitin-related modifier